MRTSDRSVVLSSIVLGAMLTAGCGTTGLDPNQRDPVTEGAIDEECAAEALSAATEDPEVVTTGTCTLHRPVNGLWARFDVTGETFQSKITNPEGIAEAIALWRGQSTANIPIAPLVCEQRRFNCPWKFFQKPAEIRFAEIAIELCDGTPSFVSANCAEFGAGTYCPWSARLVNLRDCRTNPACPQVPR